MSYKNYLQSTIPVNYKIINSFQKNIDKGTINDYFQKILTENIELAEEIKYKFNISIYATDESGNTILHFILYNLNDKFTEDELLYKIKLVKDIELLINIKNNKGLTPLHLICKKNYFEIYKFFVKKGCNFNYNVQDKYNRTPLHYACIGKKVNEETIEEFIKKLENNVVMYVHDKNGEINHTINNELYKINKEIKEIIENVELNKLLYNHEIFNNDNEEILNKLNIKDNNEENNIKNINKKKLKLLISLNYNNKNIDDNKKYKINNYKYNIDSKLNRKTVELNTELIKTIKDKTNINIKDDNNYTYCYYLIENNYNNNNNLNYLDLKPNESESYNEIICPKLNKEIFLNKSKIVMDHKINYNKIQRIIKDNKIDYITIDDLKKIIERKKKVILDISCNFNEINIDKNIFQYMYDIIDFIKKHIKHILIDLQIKLTTEIILHNPDNINSIDINKFIKCLYIIKILCNDYFYECMIYNFIDYKNYFINTNITDFDKLKKIVIDNIMKIESITSSDIKINNNNNNISLILGGVDSTETNTKFSIHAQPFIPQNSVPTAVTPASSASLPAVSETSLEKSTTPVIEPAQASEQSSQLSSKYFSIKPETLKPLLEKVMDENIPIYKELILEIIDILEKEINFNYYKSILPN